MDEHESIREHVRQHYAREAVRVQQGAKGSCAGGGPVSSCCGGSIPSNLYGACGPISSNLYRADDTAGLPAGAVSASLGCGNPTALAELRAGEIVLDLGSGGGIDVLLSARRVGPAGKAYGLDMTDEMLALARANQRAAGVSNVEFLKGEMENIPLPADAVDVIISNCVINLSADKDRVLGEAFRVLRAGGRLAISDIVVRGEMPPEIRRAVELWAGCIAGALAERDYREKLERAGFVDVQIEPVRIYGAADAQNLLTSLGTEAERVAREVEGKFASAFIRARKPGAVC